MNSLTPPENGLALRCGDYDWLTDQIMLCQACRKNEPKDRPEECPNMVLLPAGRT